MSYDSNIVVICFVINSIMFQEEWHINYFRRNFKIYFSLIFLLLFNLLYCVYVFGTSYSYYYDSSGRVLSATTPLGEGYDFVYDDNGNLLRKKPIENLIFNPSFEKEDSKNLTKADVWESISSKNTGFELVNDAASGEKAQKIWDSELSVGHFSGISQKILVAGGKEYSSSVQVQVREIKNASVQLYIDFIDAQNNYVGAHMTETSSANWNYVTLNIREHIPNTAISARVFIILRSTDANGSGNFLVDTTNFEYGSKNNLLVNGSLEQSQSRVKTSADGWLKNATANTGYELINDAISGDKAQKIWDSELGTGHFSGISQTIQVAGGKTYSANVQVQIREIKGASVQFYIDFMDEQNDFVGAQVREANTANWEYVTLNIRGSVPVTAVNARIYIILRSTSVNGTGNFVVDTANFEYGSKQNLLVNGSLEKTKNQIKPSADGWSKMATAKTGFELINDAVSGEKAQRIWDSGLRVGHFSGISQTVQVVGGKAFYSNTKVQILEVKGAIVQLYIDFVDAQNKFVGTYITDTALVNREYVALNINGSVPVTAVNARVYIILRSTSANGMGNFVVDTANFEQ
ncbi:hypothetical protein D3C76_228990 [compost metagenome]